MTAEEVVRIFGEDALATYLYLFVEALADELGFQVNLSNFSRIVNELKEQDLSADVLNYAEERAWWEFRQRFGWRLPEPSESEVRQAIYNLFE